MMIIICLRLKLLGILHYYYCHLVMVAFKFQCNTTAATNKRIRYVSGLGAFISLMFVKEEDIV